MQSGRTITRGIVLGIDLVGLIELGIKGFSESWITEDRHIDPRNRYSLGAKATVRFLAENPPGVSTVIPGMFFALGMLIGVVLVAVTNGGLWGATGVFGVLNVLVSHRSTVTEPNPVRL